MPATRLPTMLAAAALALAACQSTETADGGILTPARTEALAVAESLRAADGVGEVSVEGDAVVAIIDAPLPAAGLDDATRARIGEAARGTFTAATCRDAGLDAFFAAGGTLLLRVRGSDGGAVSEVPVTACV